MKKSLFKNICLSLACLLGIGGLTGVALLSPKEAIQVSAASTYYTEKKNYLYLFDPATNKGATTLSEMNNTGTWTVSRAPEDATSNYSLWRGIPSSETVTFTRNQSLKHIYQIEVYVQQFYSKTDPTYYPVKGTLSIGSTIVSTATSDGSQSSTSVFKNKLAYKGDEKDGAVKLSLNAVNSSTYSFYYDDIIIYYREYSAIPVTLDDNGGSGGSGTINCTYDEAMPASVKIPTRPGYRFDGYYVGTKQYYKADGKRAFTNFDIKAESATLTAKWTLMEFDITLNDNDGTGGQGSIKAIYGNAMPNLTTLPTRTGYTFQGYFDAKSGGTQYFDADGKGIGTYNLTKATTVYARWEANKYNISFEPTQGTGGITILEATYDVPLRDLTSAEIPTREPAHGHSYSFGGYYTEAPTEDENGYQTPHGKCYINDLGKGVLWKEASDTILYAYWTVDMTVTSSGYEGIWDNQYHGISVSVQSPEETTIYYGNQEGQCSDTNPEHFLKRDAGTYTIYFEARKDSYTTYRHSETIVIEKNVSIIDPRPSKIESLEYTASNQELVVAGQVDYGNMLYAVSTTNEVPDDSEFKASIPTGKLVGTYYVFYKSSGDGNHNPYAVVETEVITIDIARVDRTEVTTLNETVLAYLDTISADYPSIAATLEGVRSEVYQDAIVEDNITVDGVNQNIVKLQEALSAAKIAVTETLIEAIGTVSYPTSKDKIDAAKDYFDNVLSEEEKAAVDATLASTLDKDVVDYYDAKDVADLIKAITDPSTSEEYYSSVEVAKAAYDDLSSSNPDAYELVNKATDKDYEVILENNVEAKEVIELIEDIGELTYDGGNSDSLANIETAEVAYAALAESNPHALLLVNTANHVDLVEARESYNDVDETVKLIADIGKIEHGGEGDSEESLVIAREAYDALSEKEKALVGGYEDSYKVLDDGEHVYNALVLIDEIGEVNYDTDSEEKILAAREYYDSLSDDQKEQLGSYPLRTLVNAETSYSSLKKGANILVILLLIIICLIIAGGIWFLIVLLKRRKDDEEYENQENKKAKEVKAMSVGGLLPGIALVSHYVDAPYLVLYILSGIAILLWLTNLILAIMKKKQVGPFKKKVLAQEPSISEEEPEESRTIVDEYGNVIQIRYIKSFTAKLSQSERIVKDYYNELKNYVLSYKDVHSRVSWHYDSVTVKKESILKFAVRGKTLCVFYDLDASSLDDKYKVEEAKGRRFQDVSCLYRIKNDRRFEYAKELIDLLMKKLHIAKGEASSENFVIPFESTEALLSKGLVREFKTTIKPKEVHENNIHVSSVSAYEVDEMMSDEEAEVLIEEDKNSEIHKGKKGIINVDDLEANFEDGDTVTLEILKEKKLVAKDVGRVKLLARGYIDKKLHIDLQDYSLQAVKMIILVGGTVQRTK